MFLVPDVHNSTVQVHRRTANQFELTATYELPAQAENSVLFNANSRYKSRGVTKPPASALVLYQIAFQRETLTTKP